MNFRTTVILLVALVIVGGYLAFTSHTSTPDSVQNTNPTRVLDVTSSDVTKLTITPGQDKAIVLVRSTQTGAPPQIGPAVSDWKITAPVTVYADQNKVSDLLDALVSATSTAQVAIGANAADYGLDSPQYVVELDAGMKTDRIDVGRKEQAGNELYVRLEGKDTAQVVAADLLDRLTDATPEKLRLTRVINADATAANWLQIQRPTDPLTLEKVAGNWQMTLPTTHPTTAPVEQSVAGDVISSINNLQASEFAADGADPKRLIGVSPQATITISSQSPTTQPTATTETIEIGLPDSLLGKNVWVHATPPDVTFKVPKDSVDSILKSSLDLRNRNVVQINPDSVTEIRVVKVSPATTRPINIPSKVREIVLARRPPKPAEVAGPKLAATRPAATTKPSSVWQLVQSHVPADADDAKVTTLLANFNPLKADQFIATAPTGAGKTTYVVTITTKTGSPVTVLFTDPGDSSTDSPTGISGDLNFNVQRSLITSLDTDFTPSSSPPPSTPSLSTP